MRHQIHTLHENLSVLYTIQSDSKNKLAEKSLKKLGESNSTVGEEKILNIGVILGVVGIMLAVVLVYKEYKGI